MPKRNPKPHKIAPPPEDLIARDRRVDEALATAAKKPKIKSPKPDGVAGDDLECSFCGKPRVECLLLITGPKVAICGDCTKDAYACLLDAIATREEKEKAPELRRAPVPPPTKTCQREDRIKKLEVLTTALEERISALEHNEGAPR